MDTTNQITRSLDVIEGYLSDIEADLPWEEDQLFAFRLEWADVMYRAAIVVRQEALLTGDQQDRLINIRQRFLNVNGKLVSLNIENPFTRQVNYA